MEVAVLARVKVSAKDFDRPDGTSPPNQRAYGTAKLSLACQDNPNHLTGRHYRYNCAAAGWELWPAIGHPNIPEKKSLPDSKSSKLFKVGQFVSGQDRRD